jgi:hypothetical protein
MTGALYAQLLKRLYECSYRYAIMDERRLVRSTDMETPMAA